MSHETILRENPLPRQHNLPEGALALGPTPTMSIISFVHNSITGSMYRSDAQVLALSDTAVAWECMNFDGVATAGLSRRLAETAKELWGRIRPDAVDTDKEAE